MCHQRVKVRFGSKVEDLMKMGMVDVGKNPQQLPIDMLDGFWEGSREVAT
jgi:hypothetical protein